ncbi:MAG: methyltransferase [Bacteroidia bacterium]
MQNLNAEYWNNRYLQQQTGWDIGHASPALVQYAAQIENKSIKILIPGCGNAHEAEELINMGFTNITILDFAEAAIKNIQQKFAKHIHCGKLQLVCVDFFEHKGQYDVILEQTFFCALNPTLRADYAKKMYELLKPNGVLAGLFFDFPLTNEGPPFGGCLQEYLNYFEPYFNIKTFAPAFNSIKPREGKELFAVLKKK